MSESAHLSLITRHSSLVTIPLENYRDAELHHKGELLWNIEN